MDLIERLEVGFGARVDESKPVSLSVFRPILDHDQT